MKYTWISRGETTHPFMAFGIAHAIYNNEESFNLKTICGLKIHNDKGLHFKDIWYIAKNNNKCKKCRKVTERLDILAGLSW